MLKNLKMLNKLKMFNLYNTSYKLNNLNFNAAQAKARNYSEFNIHSVNNSNNFINKPFYICTDETNRYIVKYVDRKTLNHHSCIAIISSPCGKEKRIKLDFPR